jgi:hypothetical protein
MIWRIKSIGALNLMTDYFAYLDDADNPNVQPPVELEVVELGESAPAEAGMTRKADYLVVTVTPKGRDKQTKLDALGMAFDSLRNSSQQLIGMDNAKSEWSVMGRVINHAMRAMTSKITLQAADGVWEKTTETETLWNITASNQTKDIFVDGTVEALPTFEATPKNAKTGGFGYRKWIRLYNPNNAAVLNELVDVTNGGWDTAILTTAKMQAGGQDLRVFDGGQEVDRFLVNMDTASTKVFAGPFNFRGKIEMTLSGTIASSGIVSSIKAKDTITNRQALNRLPNRRGIVEIDNERFIYLRRDVNLLTIYFEPILSSRAARKSSMASHADGAIIKYIEHDIYVYYGNSTIAAPETDSTHAAAFEIATSTNGSRVYTSFGDKAGLRPGAWKQAIISRTARSRSGTYSGEAGDNTADPITALGMLMKTFTRGGLPIAVNAALECKFSHPGGITSVTPIGEKKRTTGQWPAFVGLEKSINGIDYTEQFNEAKPASAGVFVTITNTGSQTIGSAYKHIRFLMEGSLRAVLNAQAYFEIDAVTVALANPITAAMMAEESNYDLNCEIQNTFTYQGETKTESLFMRWTMELNQTLTANSKLRTVLNSDGTNCHRAKRLDAARLEWLAFRPGVTNQLRFIDTGTTNFDLRIKYKLRRKR